MVSLNSLSKMTNIDMGYFLWDCSAIETAPSCDAIPLLAPQAHQLSRLLDQFTPIFSDSIGLPPNISLLPNDNKYERLRNSHQLVLNETPIRAKASTGILLELLTSLYNINVATLE